MIEEIVTQAVESDGFGKELGEAFKGDKEFGKELGDAFKGDKDFGKELGNAFRENSNTEGLSHYDKLHTDNIKTRNEDMEGKKHPETGVPFERKEIKNADGEPDEGVFPVFESEFDAQLPDDLLQASDVAQEKECNKQLKEAVEKDPELAKKFTPEQLEQIKNGDTPDGYTWHHNEETGKMQLVDSETHAKTGHTGGKAIWGGGKENR